MGEFAGRGLWEPQRAPAWALRALAKGIIGPERFEALVSLTSDASLSGSRAAKLRRATCRCRARARPGCTHWYFLRTG